MGKERLSRAKELMRISDELIEVADSARAETIAAIENSQEIIRRSKERLAASVKDSPIDPRKP
jgi:hypothetical protein